MVKISFLVTTVLAYLTATAEGRAPIDRHAHRMLQQTGTANVFVTMQEKPDAVIKAAEKNSFRTDSDKRKKVSDDLEELAAISQKDVKTLLAGNPTNFISFEVFWLTNQIFIEGASANLVKKLSMHPSVASIEIEKNFETITMFGSDPGASDPMSNLTGVETIRAPEAWASNFNGAGVVIGSIDTGVRYTHSALQASYRGDEYSWYDPVSKTRSPSDSRGSGTHTMGIIVGSGGIGVAPGAKWMACKGCGTSSCSSSALLACLQWMYCPTTYNGMNKDCTKAPRVVNNSWGGVQGSTYFTSAINTLVSGGIVLVFSAGNTGPSCGTVTGPGDLANVIAVGATDPNDRLTWFSSKGPSINGLLKPDVVAPGLNVRSAYIANDTDYQRLSGTSMSAAHVTGLVALLFQQDSTATYDMIKLRVLAGVNRTHPFDISSCGGTNSTIFPNNIYGSGRVDALASLGISYSYSNEGMSISYSNEGMSISYRIINNTTATTSFVSAGDNTTATSYASVGDPQLSSQIIDDPDDMLLIFDEFRKI